MIPGFIKRIVVTTAVATGLVFLFVAAKDWRAALAFGVSSAWMMANLLVWTGLIVSMLSNKPGKSVNTALFTFLKIGFLAGGVVALKLAAPLTIPQCWGLVAGISMVIIVGILKVLGARMTGQDILGEVKRAASGEAASSASPTGNRVGGTV